MSATYTAILIHEQHILYQKMHADFFAAQATLLSQLQDNHGNAEGRIIDNTSGKTLHCYRKTTCYD